MTDQHPPNVTIQHRLPTPEEHRRLAERVGWNHAFHWPSMPRALEGSICGVVALDGERPVGMARVVGDGVLFFSIHDVAVDPDYQGQGIGRRMMDALLDMIRETAPAHAFVSLFATDAALPLYTSLGFSTGDMTGMFQVLPPSPSEQ